MEGALEGAALAGGLSGLAVAAQVAVPLAVFVGKVLLAVVEDLVEDVQILLVLGVAVDHHGSDQSLIVRPPQLHIMLVSFGRIAQAVHKVQDTAELFVPALVECHVEHIDGLLMQLGIAHIVGIVHQEPGTLDVVTGVDHAAFGDVQSGSAVQSNALQRDAQFRLDVILEDVFHAFLGAGIINVLHFGVNTLHDTGDVQNDQVTQNMYMLVELLQKAKKKKIL